MKTYIIKRIPDDLWHRAKVHAARNKITLRGLLLAALRMALDEADRSEKPPPNDTP